MDGTGFVFPQNVVEALSIAPGSVVADFGAGSGQYALSFAKEVGEEGVVYAIDVQADLLQRLKNEAHRRGYANVHVIHGDIERPHGAKVRGRTVDLVLVSNTLFQLKEPHRAFEEARRVLKLNGRLVIIDWSSPEDHAGLHIGPRKHHIYGRQKALADARTAYFEYAGNFDAGAHHFGLIFMPL